MAYFRCTGTPGGSLKVRTAQGSIASFNTNLAALLRSLKCDLNANQDLHGEDKPYPAGGGVNIWDEQTERGNIDTTTGEKTPYNYMLRSVNYIKVSPNTTLYTPVSWIQCYFYDANKAYISYQAFSTHTINVPNNAEYMLFRLSSDYGTTYNNDISINYPSTDTEYHPYENICPIVGHSELNLVRCGVNLWDEQWESGVYQTANGEPAPDANSWRSIDFIRVTPDTSYHFHKGGNQNVVVLYFYEDDDTYINYQWVNANVSDDFNFTTPANCAYMHFTLYNAASGYGLTYNHDISVSYPNTETAYAPYNGTPYLVSFGQTVYGGVYDANRGKILCTMRNDNMSDWEWEYNNGYFKTTSIGNIIKKPTSQSTLTNSFCSIFNNVTWEAVGDNDNEYAVLNSNGQLIVKCSSCTDLTQWATLISGQTLCYELATPIEIDVSELSVDTIVGVNNVFHDGNGDTEVKYLYKA